MQLLRKKPFLFGVVLAKAIFYQISIIFVHALNLVKSTIVISYIHIVKRIDLHSMEYSQKLTVRLTDKFSTTSV